jgi:hypothetical protein
LKQAAYLVLGTGGTPACILAAVSGLLEQYYKDSGEETLEVVKVG